MPTLFIKNSQSDLKSNKNFLNHFDQAGQLFKKILFPDSFLKSCQMVVK